MTTSTTSAAKEPRYLRGVAMGVLPILVLGIAILGSSQIVASRPEVVARPQEKVLPAVETTMVSAQTFQSVVYTQGTLLPLNEIGVVPEVAGRVVSVHPQLRVGGYIAAGETMLQIDPRNYELAIPPAQAQVAQAEQRLAREQAEAAVAEREWRALGQGEASPLTLREPQLVEAQAALAAARAAVRGAEIALERTEIKAPFNCMVRSESVALGMYATPGMTVARIYDTRVGQVRLPLTNDQLAILDLPLTPNGQQTHGTAVVRLHTRFGGRELRREGRIVRTEAQVDTQSRVVYAIAEIDEPFTQNAFSGGEPLAIGLFLQAEIPGMAMESVIVLPDHLLRDLNTVWVLDGENKLRIREVDVIRRERGQAVIASGLTDGDAVVTTYLPAVIDGMGVQVVSDDAPPR